MGILSRYLEVLLKLKIQMIGFTSKILSPLLNFAQEIYVRENIIEEAQLNEELEENLEVEIMQENDDEEFYPPVTPNSVFIQNFQNGNFPDHLKVSLCI